MLQLEVAGTVIQLEDDEAALVLYADPQYRGKTITIHYIYFPEGGFQGNLLDYEVKMTASMVERNTPSGTVCAAIFPRISLEDVHMNHRSVSFNIDKEWFFDTPTSIEVYAGNVTEAYLEKKEWNQ